MRSDKQKKDRKIIIRTTEKMADDYLNYCELNGYSLSKRLRILITKDLNGDIK